MLARKMFQIGDRVHWESDGGRGEGRIVGVATESWRAGDFIYDASSDNPRYIVETDEGKRAARRAAS